MLCYLLSRQAGMLSDQKLSSPDIVLPTPWWPAHCSVCSSSVSHNSVAAAVGFKLGTYLAKPCSMSSDGAGLLSPGSR